MKRLALLAIVPALVVFGCSSGDADVAASDTALAPDTVIVIDLHSPFDFPLVLAGNFGELRPYHFHGGIDFKTQGSTGHPIHCAERGYVSAVEVGPWGYGRAIFVTHPDIGLITVYGHLEAFADKIAKVVEEEQNKRECFAVSLEFGPDRLPVERGEIIGLSGNSGSSAGPHLHFETRQCSTGNAIDPLPFFADRIADTTPPELRRLSLIPIGPAVVDGKSGKPARRAPNEIAHAFTAWGKVVPAVEAFNRMDHTSNIFGIKHMTLKVDGKEAYRRTIDHFDFKRNRAINSLVYFPDYAADGRWTMTTLVPASHPLDDIVTTNAFDGIIYVLEERAFHCEFILADNNGNSLSIPFIIEGKRSPVNDPAVNGEIVSHGTLRTFNLPEAKIAIMPFTLFEPTPIDITVKNSPKYLSPLVTVGDTSIPVNRPFFIAFPRPEKSDAEKMTIARINGNSVNAVETSFAAGHLYAEASRFGSYTVVADTVAPSIGSFSGVAPVAGDSTANSPKQLSLKIADNLSGIASYKCYIDGQFVVFDHDGKTATISRSLEGFPRRGKAHKLKVVVTDAVGNANETSYDFTW